MQVFMHEVFICLRVYFVKVWEKSIIVLFLADMLRDVCPTCKTFIIYTGKITEKKFKTQLLGVPGVSGTLEAPIIIVCFLCIFLQVNWPDFVVLFWAI